MLQYWCVRYSETLEDCTDSNNESELIVMDPRVPGVCLHCGRKRLSRKRGLCWKCYTTPEIRERYPQQYTLVDRSHSRGLYTQTNPTSLPLPAKPTKALPGTEEKIRVLMARAEAGEALWHPEDANYLGAIGTISKESMGELEAFGRGLRMFGEVVPVCRNRTLRIYSSCGGEGG